jgi:hypothetical protein
MEWLTLIDPPPAATINELFNEPWTPWVIAGTLFIFSFVMGWRWAWHGKAIRSEIRKIRSFSCLPAVLPLRDDAERWHLFASEHFESAKEQLSSLL